MKTQKEILAWLRANLGKHATAGLTTSDTQALVASLALANLISYAGAPEDLFQAYSAIVRAMQPELRHLAFHAIACELDWGHREMIWERAGLGEPPRSRCVFDRSRRHEEAFA